MGRLSAEAREKFEKHPAFKRKGLCLVIPRPQSPWAERAGIEIVYDAADSLVGDDWMGSAEFLQGVLDRLHQDGFTNVEMVAVI